MTGQIMRGGPQRLRSYRVSSLYKSFTQRDGDTAHKNESSL